MTRVQQRIIERQGIQGHETHAAPAPAGAQTLLRGAQSKDRRCQAQIATKKIPAGQKEKIV